MDHDAFVRSLPPEARLSLHRRTNRHGLWHLAGHWGLIGLTAGLIAAEVPFWWLLLPVEGVLLVFSFTLMHECTHRTPFRTGWLNEIVGRLAGLVLGLPFLWFRYFHLAHHKYTNDPRTDPELVGQAKPESWPGFLLYVSGLPVWQSQISVLFRNAIGLRKDDFVPERRWRSVQLEAIIMVIIYGLVGIYSLVISTLLVKIWFLPLFFGQPVLRLYLLAEHAGCPHQPDMLANSRTLETNILLRALAWNMPYHAEHHSLPNVPFWQLPRLHARMKPWLKTTSDGYVSFYRGMFRGSGSDLAKGGKTGTGPD